MQVRIDEIVLKKRIRKNLGDLTPLMESIRKHGLLNPIVINKKKELIAGHRRLECAKKLGWQVIEANILDTVSELEKLELEMDENIHRKNLTPEEVSDGFLKLEKLSRPGFLKRFWNLIKKFFRKLFKKKKRKFR